MWVGVNFQAKQTALTFFSQNLPKNGFRVDNSENSCRNKNQLPQYTVGQFSVKMNNFEFFDPNLSKNGFWSQNFKNFIWNLHFQDAMCANFQFEQLLLFWPKFAQKGN